MDVTKPQKHFIFVHGACHGAWTWYKVKPRLEAAGHKVTALDLSASGINTKKLEELHTLDDYSLPLLEIMESITPNEKVILVGHSFGGLSLALAMDKYPEKISVAIFVAAFMPDSEHAPSYVFDKMSEGYPAELSLDTKFIPYGRPDKPQMSQLFGAKFLSSKLYQLCSAEDLELAKMLVRPTPTPTSLLKKSSKENNFSKEGYGSVKRVYIVCNQDKAIPENFQRWQIENYGVTEVKEIKDADHMPMLSKPQELCQCLLEIPDKYYG